MQRSAHGKPDPNGITDAQLDEWWRAHNGKAGDGSSAGIGIQARDRLIRRLIDELRASRREVANLIELSERRWMTL